MDIQALANPQTMAFVVIGTLLGTLLRSGAGSSALTIKTVARNLRRPFDEATMRAALAYHAARICKDGVIRASDRSCNDAEFDHAIQALVRWRSVAEMQKVAKEQDERRNLHRTRAVKTLENAGELAPVFGLAGTLLALSQLPSGGLGAEGLMPTVAMAVQTTLFGLILAHLILVPMARWLDRSLETEQRQRDELFAWFTAQIERAIPNPNKPERKPMPAPRIAANEAGEADQSIPWRNER